MKTALSTLNGGFRVRRATLCTLGIVAGVWVMAAGGCYERVVRATGPGVGGVRVEEPYQQNYEMDEWLFGTKVKPIERRP